MILLLAGTLDAPASQAQVEVDDEPVEYILQVLLLPQWRISESIFAYEKEGKYYLPIMELSKGFEFFADREEGQNYVSGFASSEENSFVIDGERKELIIKGVREKLPDDAILVSDYLATDDIFVQLEVLNRIWPVKLYMDLSSLTVNVEAEEELSFMRRKERESKREMAESRKAERLRRKELLPFRENPYDILGKPVLDYQAIYKYDTQDDNIVGQNVISGKQQIAKMIADYSTSFFLTNGRVEEPRNIRLKLSRQSADDDYLVSPFLRSFEGGDVTLSQRDLIGNTSSGRGIVISNDNKNRDNEFDRITVEGTGPPGWEIELYNNDELIDFGTVEDDGQYFFEDVILEYGNNQIKILFFGPQGQVREENRSYSAGGNMLTPGEFRYKAGLLDSDKDFIPIKKDDRQDPEGAVQTVGGAYGVNRWLTLFGNYTSLPFSQGDYSYLTSGASIGTPIGLAETEIYKQIGGGEALDARYVASLIGFRTNLRTSFFKDFESEDAGFGSNRKKFEAEAQASRTLRLFHFPIGTRFTARHTERESGSQETTYNATQTLSYSGVRVGHTSVTRIIDHKLESTNGTLTSTIREGDWQFRGGLGYMMRPKAELSSVNSEIRYTNDKGFQAAWNFSNNFSTHDYRTGVQVGYDFKYFLGSIDTNYIRNGGWEFMLRATTSLNPYTPDGSYQLDSYSRKNNAPVLGRVYLDKNADGVFNEDDEPMPDVKLLIGGGRSKEESDEEGYIVTSGQDNKKTNISIDTRTLPDPYQVPKGKGFSTILTEGKMLRADFPIIETGAIEGTLMKSSDGRAVPGVTLNLLDETGEVVMSSETAFDGYFTFEFVPPGGYTIVADKKHGITLEEAHVTISPDDLFVYGNDVYYMDGDGDQSEEKGVASADMMDASSEADDMFGDMLTEDVPSSEVLSFEAESEEVPEAPLAEDSTPDEGTSTDLTDEVVVDAPAKVATTGTSVSDIRLKSHRDKARLVLELSDLATYEVIQDYTTGTVIITLRGVEWNGPADQKLEVNGKVFDYNAQKLPNGARIVIGSSQNVETAYYTVLPATRAGRHRFLIDVY